MRPQAPHTLNMCESATADPSLPQDREALTAGIKSLSNALAALPETVEFAAQRAALNASIAAYKAQIVRIKPLGAQLDGCKAALTRALAREASAHAEVQKATTALEHASAEVGNIQKELASLELAVTLATSQTSETTSQSRAMNSMQGLAVALERVLGELKAGQAVPPSLVGAAQDQMRSLYTNIQAISAAVVSTSSPPASDATTRPAAAVSGDPADRNGPNLAAHRRLSDNGKGKGANAAASDAAAKGPQVVNPNTESALPSAGQTGFTMPEAAGGG